MHLIQVDAFTDTPFGGNPAAVCVLREAAGAPWMQRVANEMNLSETAFLVPRGAATYGLRWFTPTDEVDLCGHATLASAHVLFEDGHAPADAVLRFETASGTLTCRRGEDGRIAMDFPAEPPQKTAPPEGLLEALGLHDARYVGRNRMDLVVEVEGEAAVRGMAPDMTRLERVETRGVIVTARAEEASCDFVSRFFGPRVGVPEDPVTGSAHCGLAPFWAERLRRSRLVGRQVSARGGTVYAEVQGERVVLSGHAVTVLRAELVGRAAVAA